MPVTKKRRVSAKIAAPSAVPKCIPQLPLKGQPQPNEILNLNDDCLLHVMSFVDDNDLVNLRHVHPRFRRLFRVRARHGWKNGLTVTQQFIDANPLATCRDLYQTIGRWTKSLIVHLEVEKEFLGVLKHFPKISELHIFNTELKNIASIDAFPRVTSLTLRTQHTIPVHYVKRLFRHLDRSLKYLHYSQYYLKDLLLLHNLVEICIPIEGIRRGLKEFLLRNPQLEVVTVTIVENSVNMPEDWIVLAQAANLKRLAVKGLGLSCPDLRSLPRFYNITGFDMWAQGSWCTCHEYFFAQMGGQLKQLTVMDDMDYKEEIDFLGKIGHLTELEQLYAEFQVFGDDVDIVRKVAKLEAMRVLHLRVKSAEVTLQIVKELPMLEQFSNDLVVDNHWLMLELQRFLIKDGRQLQYNGSECR